MNHGRTGEGQGRGECKRQSRYYSISPAASGYMTAGGTIRATPDAEVAPYALTQPNATLLDALVPGPTCSNLASA